MAMTTEERQAFFDQYGCWPIEDSDIPDNEKVILTEEQIAEGAIIFAKKQAKQYLANTDWYVSRYTETGTEIPEEVLTKRAQARIDASED